MATDLVAVERRLDELIAGMREIVARLEAQGTARDGLEDRGDCQPPRPALKLIRGASDDA